MFFLKKKKRKKNTMTEFVQETQRRLNLSKSTLIQCFVFRDENRKIVLTYTEKAQDDIHLVSLVYVF